jgi:hypothetical protein
MNFLCTNNSCKMLQQDFFQYFYSSLFTEVHSSMFDMSIPCMKSL